MKKLLFKLFFCVCAVALFSTQSNAQQLTFINPSGTYQIVYCGNNYSTGGFYPSPCGTTPSCFFDVIAPCSSGTRTVRVTHPNCGATASGSYTHNEPATLVPPCAGFSVRFEWDASGNVNIEF